MERQIIDIALVVYAIFVLLYLLHGLYWRGQMAAASNSLLKEAAVISRICINVAYPLQRGGHKPDMIAMLDAWRAPHSEPLTTEKLDQLIGNLDRRADPLGR